MHRVISYYALTDQFRRFFEMRGDGPVEFSTLTKLRQLGLFATFRAIRALRASRITIAIENENSRPLAGPLALVAVISGSPRIGIVWPDKSSEMVPRWKAVVLLFKIARAQIVGRLAYRRATRDFTSMESQSLPKRAIAPASATTVLYLDANLSVGVEAGGSVGHTKGVIDALIKSGYKVDYASIKHIPTSTAGAQWKQVPAPDLYSFPADLNYYAFNRQYERQIEEWAHQRSYAFLYQRMSLHNFSGASLGKRLGLPLVLEYNGSEAWAWANWGERLKLHDMAVAAERISLQNADLVVTVSKVLADEVVAAGVPRERIVTYPNCIDPQIFDPERFSSAERLAIRHRWSIPEDRLVATFVGTFGRWHGVDFLAKAIGRLVREQRDWVETNKLHFLFIGDGLKMSEVKSTIESSETSPYVTLTGLIPQRDTPAYLAASDIFLSPHLPNPDGSAFFGSPTKLFEYMAMQRPIIASELDQIGQVLRGTYLTATDSPGKPLAALFAPGNEEGFLRALRQIVDDPIAATDMARRARKAALNSYTWDHHVTAILVRMRDLGIVRPAPAFGEEPARGQN